MYVGGGLGGALNLSLGVLRVAQGAIKMRLSKTLLTRRLSLGGSWRGAASVSRRA
jgi:hypothetical protein